MATPHVIINRVLSPDRKQLAVKYNGPKNLTLAPFDPKNIPKDLQWLINPTTKTIVVPVPSPAQQAIPKDNFVAAGTPAVPQHWTFDKAPLPFGGIVIQEVGGKGRVWEADADKELDSPDGILKAAIDQYFLDPCLILEKWRYYPSA
ncbi:hypothetical protein BS47DRAFT_1481654 [Hydnum rufescens UP504]|uniref:CCL2-like lectin domain-containing protein n=1 Tax=Hydnum rufescens UP504 TaxID=1448309 RepID=A0A9P6BA33_9AGAM|nr:hypothetical protein BS47DRAFT_1481654 [Hydnum rufescens UP504]